MNREEIRKTLEAILFDLSFIEAGYHIHETDHYENDYGLDSLDILEMVEKIEEAFDIDYITLDETDKIHTVKDTIDYLEKEIINHKS